MYRPTKDERTLLIALGGFVFILIGGYVAGALLFAHAWSKALSTEAQRYYAEAARAASP